MLTAGQDYRTSIHQTYFVFVTLFSKPILTKQNIASTKNSQQFLASQVSVLRRNKAKNSSTSKHPFFSCNESPCTRQFIQAFRLVNTFAREVCHLGIKMKKNMTNGGNLTSLNKLPNTRVFVAAQNELVEVLKLVALFLLKYKGFHCSWKMDVWKYRCWWLYFSSKWKHETLKTVESFS